MAGASSSLSAHLLAERAMLAIRPNVRATPAVHCEIARSREPTGMLAGRYGTGAETIHKR